MAFARFIILLALLSWQPVAANAQARSHALDVIPWHVRVEPDTVRPGGVARLVFQARLGESEDGPWKMYALGSPRPSRAVSITLNSLPEGVRQPAPMEQWGAERGFDQWFDTTVVYFEGHALLWSDLSVSTASAEGVREVHGEIAFMVCNDRICLPPATLPFAATFNVKDDASGALPPIPPQYVPELIGNDASQIWPVPD